MDLHASTQMILMVENEKGAKKRDSGY